MFSWVKKHVSEFLLSFVGILLVCQIFVGMVMDGVIALIVWGLIALYIRKVK